jgi:hypothetical protein
MALNRRAARLERKANVGDEQIEIFGVTMTRASLENALHSICRQRSTLPVVPCPPRDTDKVTLKGSLP